MSTYAFQRFRLSQVFPLMLVFSIVVQIKPTSSLLHNSTPVRQTHSFLRNSRVCRSTNLDTRQKMSATSHRSQPGKRNGKVPRHPLLKGERKPAMADDSGVENLPRLFVGLPLSNSVLQKLSEIPVVQVPSLRALPTDSLHITLHFLGASPLHSVITALQSVQMSPFALSVAGIGAFPSVSNANVVWAGVRPSVELSALKTAVDTALVKAALANPSSINQTFSPHITIARSKTPRKRRNQSVLKHGNNTQGDKNLITNQENGKNCETNLRTVEPQLDQPITDLEQLLTKFEAFDAGQIHVNSFILYESILNTGKIVYEEREKFDLIGTT